MPDSIRHPCTDDHFVSGAAWIAGQARNDGLLGARTRGGPAVQKDSWTGHNLLIMDPKLLQLLVTREMPYGKYKGRILADLPGNYLAWFAREGFPPGELGRLLSLMLEIDHNGLAPLLEPLRQGTKPGSK